MSDIIRLENVSKIFKTAERDIKAINNINLSIEKGKIYGIIGLSGAGKSTLVRLMNLLEIPSEGKVFFNNQNLQELKDNELRTVRRKIGMIFQNFNLLEQKTVLKNVLFPLEISKINKTEAEEKVRKLLSLVDLSKKEKNYPSQLSGGQKQRVAIARALASDPEVILCDEATSALDPKTTSQILDLLKKINKELGVTIVIITHQMSVIESICDEVAIIDKAEIVEKGKVSDIFKSPKSEIGRRLIFGGNDTEEAFVLPKDNRYKYLRLVFDGSTTNDPILSNIILEHKCKLNIMHANTKTIDNKAFGQLIVGIDKNYEGIDKIRKYLLENHVELEEVE